MIWDQIPDDAVAWFRNAFLKANKTVSEVLLNVPNIRETSLDDGLVEALIPHSAPRLMPSGALVRMHIHNIGGLRRVGRWEAADIALIVYVVRANTIVARKIAFLQSKRLYPTNNDVEPEDPEGFRWGMNALLRPDPSPVSMTIMRRFEFHHHCMYAALKPDSDQMKSINEYLQSGYDVDYLFYNPHKLPLSVSYPLEKLRILRTAPTVGCRVVDAATVHSILSRLPSGAGPTYNQIERSAGNSHWRLEYWAADLLLSCKVGREFTAAEEDEVARRLERRTGPIGAAIAVYIELPPERSVAQRQ